MILRISSLFGELALALNGSPASWGEPSKQDVHRHFLSEFLSVIPEVAATSPPSLISGFRSGRGFRRVVWVVLKVVTLVILVPFLSLEGRKCESSTALLAPATAEKRNASEASAVSSLITPIDFGRSLKAGSGNFQTLWEGRSDISPLASEFSLFWKTPPLRRHSTFGMSWT